MPDRPSPFELWGEAGYDAGRYSRLLREHGYMVPEIPQPPSPRTAMPFRLAAGRNPVPLEPGDCEQHTPHPESFRRWAEWASQMHQTHTRRQCHACGLWAVWEPKGTADA